MGFSLKRPNSEYDLAYIPKEKQDELKANQSPAAQKIQFSLKKDSQSSFSTIDPSIKVNATFF